MTCKTWLNRRQLIAIMEDLVAEGRGWQLVFGTGQSPAPTVLKYLEQLPAIKPSERWRVKSVLVSNADGTERNPQLEWMEVPPKGELARRKGDFNEYVAECDEAIARLAEALQVSTVEARDAIVKEVMEKPETFLSAAERLTYKAKKGER